MLRPIKKVKFEDWVRTYGVQRLAKRLGVSDTIVWCWCAGKGWPRVDHMITMIRVSKGVLTFDAIVARHLAKRRQEGRSQ